MATCDVCGKSPSFGKSYSHRGIAIYKGGVGIKITGITRRKFMPNVQRVRVQLNNGTVTRQKVCTGCIRSGKVIKPRKREIPEGLRQRMRAREEHWSAENRKKRAAARAQRRRARKAGAKG